MRTKNRCLRTLGATVALAATLLAVNASQAMAVQWSPQGTSVFSAMGSGGVQFSFPNQYLLTCGSTMGGTTVASQLRAFPSSGGVTFTNCGGALWSGTTITLSSAIVTANTTSTATISAAAGTWTLSRLGCTVKIGGAGAISVPAQWSNSTHSLSVSPVQLPFTSTGAGCINYSLPASGQVTFYVPSLGWAFYPLLTIV